MSHNATVVTIIAILAGTPLVAFIAWTALDVIDTWLQSRNRK